jgi:hypothetical protein
MGIDKTHYPLIARDVVANVQLLRRDETELPRTAKVEELIEASPLGRLTTRDEVPARFRTRVVAARLRKWLETTVVPRQDILVDAPHLVSQIPGLLPDPSIADSWRGTCVLHCRHADIPLADHAALADAAFPTDETPWSTRPLWWVADIASSAALDEARDRGDESLALVFCEDASAFAERAEGHRVSTSVGGNRAQRWVLMHRDNDGRLLADYEPAVRLVD